MLRLWLRLRLRRQLISYLETGNAADRTAMLQAARYLFDCGETHCQVNLRLEDLVFLQRQPEEPKQLEAVRA